MKKNLLKFIFTLFALIVGTSVNAQTSGSCGTNATWSYEGTTLTISGSGEMSDFDIVEYVTTAPWKDYLEAIKTIEIESGVTSVGNNAFFGCTALTSVTFPSDGFTRIGDYAFSGCTSFENLNMPSSMTTIGYGAFSDSGVKGATIYGGVQKIGDYAFESCGNLEGVAIYEGVEEIGECAFDGCAFTSVVIPSTVTTIGEGAFMLNDKLESVYIGAKVTNIGAGAFQFCTSLRSVGIGGATAPTLGDAVFTGEADALLDIDVFYVPSTTPYSGGWGGYAASKFKTLYEGTWTNSDVPEQGSGTWSFDVPTGTLTVNGTGIMDVNPWMDMTAINPMIYEEEHPGFWSNVKKLVVGEGITELRSLCVAMQINCASVTLPSTLTYVGNSCLEECAFTSITLPEGLKTIDDYTFYGSKLTTITLPSSLTYLGNSAFLDNKDLATVTCLGTTPPTCGSSENPFGDGSYLTAIYVPAEAVNAYQEANKWSTYATKIQAAVSKTDPEVTAPTAVQDLKYSGAAQTLITAGSTTGGTLQYSLDGENYSTELPKGTDAKQYTIHYKVVGNDEYNDVAAKTITATIAAKVVTEPTITLNPSTFVYDGEAKEPEVTVKDGETTILASEYNVSYSNNINAGTATVTITDKENGNYTVNGTATFTITATGEKADPEVTAPTAIQDLKYSGAAQTLINAGSTTGGTLQYSIDGENYSTELPKGTDAKQYTIHYKVVGNDEYNDVAAKTITATIAAKVVTEPTITLEPTYYVFDNEAKEPKVTVMDGEATIKAEEYTISYKKGETAVDECKEIGTYIVVITDKEGGNYTVNGTATFTITSTGEKADPEVTAPTAIQDLIYNGKAQELIAAGSTTGGTMQYSIDGENFSTELPKGTDAKQYTVYYKVVGNEEYNDVEADKITVTIAAKVVTEPTITLEPTYYVFDNEAKEPKVTVMDGEATIKAEEYTISYKKGETAVDECKEIGTYIVVITDKENGNYTVSGTTTFTITEKPNKDIVDEESPVLIGGEPFYEPTKEIQEAIKENFNKEIALSAEASNRMEVTAKGSVKFSQGPSFPITVLNLKSGGKMRVDFYGQVKVKDTEVRRNSIYTRGRGDSSSDGMIDLVSGAEYEVLKDGPLVLTIVLEEEEATLEGITVTEAETEPVTIEIGKNGKTTYTGKEALDFSGFEDLKAYVATGYESDGTVWLTRVKKVPAGVSVLIKGTKETSYDVPVLSEYEAQFENMFKGSADEEQIISTTTEDGKYKNFYMSGGQFKPASASQKIGAGKAYLQVPATFNAAVSGENQTVKIADSGKSSYAPPVDIDVTDVEGLKAYAATGYDAASSTIWLTRINKIQAGEGVMLKGEAGKTYTLPAAEVQAYYGNMFVGNIDEKITINETSGDGEWTNFYLASGSFKKVTGTREIGTKKSYLQLPTSLLVSSARGKNTAGIDEWFMEELETETILLGSIGGDDEGGTTRIDAIANDSAQPDVYYNLQGQRVDTPKKGLYIKNGHKVVIK